MLWGFFKKLVIADQIAQIIDPMYRNVPTESSLLFVVAVLFTFQLYADFSGYSDIAIGAAKMLGFQLQINFNRPFVATSLSDFWRRWHISLSNWLRDYLYYPLALSTGKKSTYKLYFALFVTFVLIGLWHGANWTFVFFGMFHGTYLVVELLTDPVRKKIRSALGFSSQVIWYRFIQQSVVFFAATCSFIIFRSETLSSAKRFIEQLFTMPSFLFIRYELFSTLAVSVGSVIVIAVGISILSMLFVEYIQEKKKTFFIVEDKPAWIRYTWYYGLTLAILFFGYFGSETFIYFKF
jgi:D-alanyl-lipoteichoic acid acyltransferase DltB (MBOAT superfamily)